MQSFTKQGKKYIALKNAYKHLDTNALTKEATVYGDYSQFFKACDKTNGQIKNTT